MRWQWNLERYQGDLILLNVASQSDTGLKVVLTGAGNLTVYRTSDDPWYITGTGLGDVPYQCVLLPPPVVAYGQLSRFPELGVAAPPIGASRKEQSDRSSRSSTPVGTPMSSGS